LRTKNLPECIKLFSVFFILLFLPTGSTGDTSYSLEEAKKVFRIIHEIELGREDTGRAPYKKVKLSESELNSYIAYRIEFERSLVMKELKVKIFDERRIEGKIYIDMRGYDPPRFLRPEMNFYFSGVLEVRQDQVRLNLKELFLERQKIDPVLLDLVIFIAARLQGEEASTIGEWYDLPLGIKEIETKPGEVSFGFE
jgi:hypothetical protein